MAVWGVMEQVGARGGEGSSVTGWRPRPGGGRDSEETKHVWDRAVRSADGPNVSGERVRSVGRTLPASCPEPQGGGLGRGMFGEAVGWRGVRCQVLGEHMTTEVPGDTHVEEAGSGGGRQRHPAPTVVYRS